nr:11535_t:CDS:2 [Entrophospora candida]
MTTQTRTNIREKLAEFAANTTYQLWCLKKSPSSMPPLTNASPQFIRFCKQLIMGEGPISTEDGWEYRLFTVSLILANKILDDHSYTNNTWSKVTTIPLLELNQAEQEFLKNCGYELYPQKARVPPGMNLPGIAYLLERSQSQDRNYDLFGNVNQTRVQQSQDRNYDLFGNDNQTRVQQSQDRNYDLFGNDNQTRVQRDRHRPGPGVIQRPVRAIAQDQSTHRNEGSSAHSSTSGHKVAAISFILNNQDDDGIGNIDNSTTRYSSGQNSQDQSIGSSYDLFGNGDRLISINNLLNNRTDDKIRNNNYSDQSFAEPVFQDQLSSNNGSGYSLTSIDYILNDSSSVQQPVSQDQLDSNYDLFGNGHGFSSIYNHTNNQSDEYIDNSVTQHSAESNSQNQSLSSSYDSYSDGDRFKYKNYLDNNGIRNLTESISQDQIMNSDYDSCSGGDHRFTSINHLFNNTTDKRHSFIRPPPGFRNIDTNAVAQSSPVAQIRPPPGFEKIDLTTLTTQSNTASQVRPPPGFENVDHTAVDRSSTTVSRSNVARPTAADQITATFGRTPRMMYQHLVASRISSNPPTPIDEPRGITKYVPVTIAGAFAAFRN